MARKPCRDTHSTVGCGCNEEVDERRRLQPVHVNDFAAKSESQVSSKSTKTTQLQRERKIRQGGNRAPAILQTRHKAHWDRERATKRKNVSNSALLIGPDHILLRPNLRDNGRCYLRPPFADVVGSSVKQNIRSRTQRPSSARAARRRLSSGRLGEARRAIAPAMSSDWASRCNACIPIVRRGPHRSRWSSTSRSRPCPALRRSPSIPGVPRSAPKFVTSVSSAP